MVEIQIQKQLGWKTQLCNRVKITQCIKCTYCHIINKRTLRKTGGRPSSMNFSRSLHKNKSLNESSICQPLVSFSLFSCKILGVLKRNEFYTMGSGAMSMLCIYHFSSCHILKGPSFCKAVSYRNNFIN